LNSRDARIIRILAEFIEPFRRFRDEKIKDTIVFLGSARIKPQKTARGSLRKLIRANVSSSKIKQAGIELEMSKYYEDTVELAYRLTEWSMKLKPQRRFVVCSGGGPGIMEAANLGASRAKGLSIGLNISLPFEQYPNKHTSKELNFEFHYFFMRKFWFAYLAKALVIMPGGFGTMDEFFEILTLVQTRKIKKKMPIVLYDANFWEEIINLKHLHRKGLVSRYDLGLFKMVNSVDEAFEYLKDELSRHYINIPTSLLNKSTKEE
jgi:uncharacterized protein (TIGR00730 family)